MTFTGRAGFASPGIGPALSPVRTYDSADWLRERIFTFGRDAGQITAEPVDARSRATSGAPASTGGAGNGTFMIRPGTSKSQCGQSDE
ncbi:MAG TPA: hypothetical protein VGP05_00245 [Pseudonocardia sp.]|nr:hypothetical protein [Pseudonocardia sp.]